MKLTKIVTAAAVVGLGLSVVAASPGVASSTDLNGAALAAAIPVLALPKPTGPLPIGSKTLPLFDQKRPDPWVPTIEQRELPVTLWYPARSASGAKTPYVSAAESKLLLASLGVVGMPDDLLATTKTHSLADALPAARPGGRPLVVLSPGFTLPRSSLTALAEDLASKGYIVAGIDHTYETSATTLADGRVVGCEACKIVPKVTGPDVSANRAADVRFVLDELTRSSTWSPLIDRSRIAAVGHSMGGASAALATITDRRVVAGVNLDGTLHAPVAQLGVPRPILLVGKDKVDGTWTRAWSQTGSWKRWVAVTGTSHFSFTDYGVLADQIGTGLEGQTVPGARIAEITRAYVGAFLDKHLRGRSGELLDGPSEAYPEVTFRP